MSEKREKVVILGGSGSGKDYLMRKLAEKGMKPCLKWTTRPIRKFEKQGINYNFVSEDLFLQTINEDKFLSCQKFEVTPEDSEPQTWYYGITLEEFHKSDIFIMTPGEFRVLSPELRKGCCVVYLNIDRETREKRLNNRKDKNDSIQRRLDADEEDFKQSFDYDLGITDPDFGADDVYSLID